MVLVSLVSIRLSQTGWFCIRPSPQSGRVGTRTIWRGWKVNRRELLALFEALQATNKVIPRVLFLFVPED